MKTYYIKDEDNSFWCQGDYGYWSNFKSSLKNRFQGIWLYVFPLYLLMKLYGVKCTMVLIR